jgi:hypothetical protein
MCRHCDIMCKALLSQEGNTLFPKGKALIWFP